MRSRKLSIAYSAFLAVFVVIQVSAPAAAQQGTVLHSFNPGVHDGVNPQSTLVFDAAGNLYGTAYSGGVYSCFGMTFSCGTVFELSPAAGGGWTEKTLHNFGHGSDGYSSSAALIVDASGNLYGTTIFGGAYGYGTVFEMSPAANGWSEKVLHHFNFNGRDGYNLYGHLTLDAAGNLYGIANGGGTGGGGIVFELTPSVNGKWSEKILHNFAFNGRDGVYPWAGLVADVSGNLYGTTAQGGLYGYGTVFELTPALDGTWTEKILHNFNYDGQDAVQSYTDLALDAKGNLFGTTGGGGAYGYGAVFELSSSPSGSWTERVIYSFNSNGEDGTQPVAGVTISSSGVIYGTTRGGGANALGTVFELTPTAGGGFSEKILQSFSGVDGEQPESGLILDAAGNLYGTTNLGGAVGTIFGYGTVFELTP